MKKLFYATSVIVAFTLFLTACSSEHQQNQIEKELNIDVSNGREISQSDDHGGFHNDGTSCIVYRFSDDSVLNQIRKDNSWKAFPMDETVTALVYGTTDESSSVGPYLKDDGGNTLVPEIQNGYYVLIDRQMNEEEDVLHRASFNFTIGIYDTDTDTLYFCRYDT